MKKYSSLKVKKRKSQVEAVRQMYYCLSIDKFRIHLEKKKFSWKGTIKDFFVYYNIQDYTSIFKYINYQEVLIELRKFLRYYEKNCEQEILSKIL